MTLDEAMSRNGVPGDAPVGVVVAVAPQWMQRLWIGSVVAMTLPRTIYFSPKAFADLEAGGAGKLLTHELEHVRQWHEHGRVAFAARYLRDYVGARLAGFDHDTAYRAIGFEREAVAASRRTE